MICNKTPISLMNEVCKANNVVPEYKVVEETGPPHEKSFKVELTLQNVGSYEGEASTIRGAKHKAAQLGLETSGLTKPERKVKQLNDAPSVKLNSLAMKLGKTVEYCDLGSVVKPYSGPSPIPSNTYGQFPFQGYTPGMLPNRRPQTKVAVSIKIGDKEYLGEGFGKKEARRNAASKALADLYKELDSKPVVKQDQSAVSADNVGSEIPDPKVITIDGEATSLNTMPIKSPISEVYEIASKRKMKIDFEVVSSTGPPHHRTFVTTVTVGEFKASGEGPSKKVSKHLASSKVLEELRNLPPLAKSQATSRLYKHGGYPKNSAKELDPSLNPISLLGQLRQRRKETLPVYTLVNEEGVRSKEFTIQVQVDSHTAKGSGANKKEAKKNAAEAMLQLLGVRSSKPAPGSESNSEKSQKQDEEKATEKGSGSEGRTLPPGLLPILPEMANRNVIPPTAVVVPPAKPLTNIAQPVAPTVTVLNRAPGAPVGKPMSDEILQNGSTPSMQKLQQLAKSGGFQVQYQDTSTQENSEQYLAVVTISTVPPLVCRGFGPTLELAFEHAASNALIPLVQPPVATNGPVIDAAPGN